MGVKLYDLGENSVGKEEIASNFFFSHYVFKSYLLLMRQNEYLWSKGLTGFSFMENNRDVSEKNDTNAIPI